MLDLALRDGFAVSDLHSWQGVRRDESENRKNALDRELIAGRMDQGEYDLAVKRLDVWVQDRHREVSRAA